MQLQPITINFAQGVNTKSDAWQVPIGQFLSLENSIFTTQGQLRKRNGYGLITTIPNSTTVTTYDDNLITLSTNVLSMYSADTNTVLNKGYTQPLSLSVQPLVRRPTSQTTVDTAIASNNLCCSVWIDENANSYYQINDSLTNVTIVPAVSITSGTEVSATMPRVFAIGNYFIITYLATVAATHTLRYIKISINNPTIPFAPATIATTISSITAAYDGVVALGPEILYLAWNGSDGGGAIRIVSFSASAVLSTTTVLSGAVANLLSLTYDESRNNLWVSYWTSSASTISVAAYTQTLTQVLAPTVVASSTTLHNGLTSTANAGIVNVYYEVSNFYGYDSSLRSDYVSYNTCTLAGVAGTPAVLLRGVGLGSKATYVAANSASYMLVTYGSAYQPTYFLVDGAANIVGKLAYANGGGYVINQILPQINQSGMELQIGYLFKDFLASIANPVGPLGSNVGTNNTQGAANSVPIYTQLGINLASFTFGAAVPTAETGSILHLGEGFPWMFDGVKPVEHQFHLWPDAVEATTATTGGLLTAQQYFYQAIYYWTDGQGNPQYSAASVPVSVTTTGTTSANTIYIPTLRLTAKNSTNVPVLRLYRWSTANQNYYEVTSVQSPTLNNPAVDYITFIDTLADSSIIGNSLIYTTGGVVEDIAGPSFSICSMFDDRLWVVDAEDPYTMWYSKQVLNGTGVEFSDLFTYYVAPTQGAQGSTGPITSICPMDTELIVFKKDAMYYLNGAGPDNTGANSTYSQPIFISSTVGCANPNSIVLMDEGIMFQSDKGIWLLGRNLQPSYIGQFVEKLVLGNIVTSATVVPGTTQVRFTLNTGITVMYDYLYRQWGTFTNTPAISATLWQGLHTYLNPYGQIVQETIGKYLDISTQVLLGFTTNWIQLGGLSGYQRFVELQILGAYLSPHNLVLTFGYDYGPLQDYTTIAPTNGTGVWGSDSLYGQTTPWGGPLALEQWRVQQSRQRCQSFQMQFQEIKSDGAGLTLSAFTAVVGVNRNYRPIKAVASVGTNNG
jgi:hypothetical protein